MSTLLQINTSLFGENGQSSQLSQYWVKHWRESHLDGQVIERDLARNPVPHLSADTFMAFNTPEQQRTDAQRQAVALSDQLIDELRRADAIVLGLPLYNFGVPSALKAYIDHIARAGVTFRYTENGPVGLLGEKKVTVLAARGGRYAGTPADVQTAYIQQIFSFIGLGPVEFIYAEGLNMGGDNKDAALRQAHRSIEQQVA